MTKVKRKPSTASNQGSHVVRPLHLALIVSGLCVTAVAFAVVQDPTLKILCLATAATLVWHWLRASGRL
jgi:hypothetical protein